MVVRLYLPWESPRLPPGETGQDHSRAQIRSAQANGCTIGGYCWLYRDADPIATASEAVSLARSCGTKPPVLWVDVETYQSQAPPAKARVRTCCLEAQTLGVRAGIYASRLMWSLAPGGTSCADFLLWDAWQNPWITPDAGYDPGYGGWAIASGRQWSSEGVDQSVFLREATA